MTIKLQSQKFVPLVRKRGLINNTQVIERKRSTKPDEQFKLIVRKRKNLKTSTQKKVKQKFCLCPCKKEFWVPKGGKRIFFKDSCKYQYYKSEALSGRKQPDGETRCYKCGINFQYWFVLSGGTVPKHCRSADCSFNYDENKLFEADFLEIYKQFKYSYKNALLVRLYFCNQSTGIGGAQCKNYTNCLPNNANEEAKIFIKFFETKGMCYEKPD